MPTSLLDEFGGLEKDKLIGRIWGLGERQIQKILKHADESALGADDFAEFFVILQQILKKRRNE